MGAHRVLSYANIRCIVDVKGNKRLNVLYNRLILSRYVVFLHTAVSCDPFHFYLLYIL